MTENANLGTDHGTANVMFLAGHPVVAGHYGSMPNLTDLTETGNLRHTTDFHHVYATAASWLGVDPGSVLPAQFKALPAVSRIG